MGFCGIFCYQFLENCAIYYTNASNVAIFVSFGPIVTAALARMFTKDRSLSAALVVGSLIAVGGVALVSLNGVVNLHLRPLGDFSRRLWALSLPRSFWANAQRRCPFSAVLSVSSELQSRIGGRNGNPRLACSCVIRCAFVRC